MSKNLWHIGLSAWIIQDGNYNNFAAGDTYRFALEYYAEKKLVRSQDPIGLIHQDDAHYQATGRVCFVASDVLVLDFGGLLAFREDSVPHYMKIGTIVSGEIYLGIDPFFYFEDLYKRPGIPPLIYEWELQEIMMETAPYKRNASRNAFVRDASQLHRIPLTKTDASNDDNGNGDYVLICRKTDAPPLQQRND